ncbi:hypothetical protein GUJ93_ZPchr0015g6839 [Zizania palustris]|uniref:Uncharacterized protein n=1 Tax=Zizania palustris TaxID=103762 RepID=A0A8J5VST2_ZIZPA|nr:hypothetical protein GUJ93_ZPchr0015g6839 [Zizania palustris]
MAARFVFFAELLLFTAQRKISPKKNASACEGVHRCTVLRKRMKKHATAWFADVVLVFPVLLLLSSDCSVQDCTEWLPPCSVSANRTHRRRTTRERKKFDDDKNFVDRRFVD